MNDRDTPFVDLRDRIELGPDHRLRLRGQEMILLPRHFFRDIQRNVYEMAGPEVFRAIFGRAGYDGAVKFCRAFQKHHGCTRRRAVEGYLEEMSMRGWGHFAIRMLDDARAEVEVELSGSAIPAEDGYPSGHIVWSEAMKGAVAFLHELGESATTLQAQVEERDDGCRIRVYPGEQGA